MNPTDALRPLSALNENYQPPQPWRCVTLYEHECTGHVVGAVGAIPVCEAGQVVEVAARVADRERMARWMADNADLVAREARWEQSMEARYS